MRYNIAIDLWGTNVKCAILSIKNGNIIKEFTVETKVDHNIENSNQILTKLKRKYSATSIYGNIVRWTDQDIISSNS